MSNLVPSVLWERGCSLTGFIVFQDPVGAADGQTRCLEEKTRRGDGLDERRHRNVFQDMHPRTAEFQSTPSEYQCGRYKLSRPSSRSVVTHVQD